ncbi:MAG: Asp-tRNA(Asn)/Glu-tRNA(Gln) amidotransferase subunit GatC [Mycoplasma sp.]
MKNIYDKLQNLANSLEFELDNVEIEKIHDEYNAIIKKLNLIKEFDTKNIEPTNFIHEISLEKNWREDMVEEFCREDVFSNTTLNDDKYVVIKDEK